MEFLNVTYNSAIRRLNIHAKMKAENMRNGILYRISNVLFMVHTRALSFILLNI